MEPLSRGSHTSCSIAARIVTAKPPPSSSSGNGLGQRSRFMYPKIGRLRETFSMGLTRVKLLVNLTCESVFLLNPDREHGRNTKTNQQGIRRPYRGLLQSNALHVNPRLSRVPESHSRTQELASGCDF